MAASAKTNKTITDVVLQLRNDTAANWSTSTYVLKVGELGLDTTNYILKMGNGVSTWNSLLTLAQPSEGSIQSTNKSGSVDLTMNAGDVAIVTGEKTADSDVTTLLAAHGSPAVCFDATTLVETP